ncbi:hypothetical protein BGZ46_006221, partial [Entomortierella lignicola]
MIFDKLLASSPIPSEKGFKEGAKKVTGNVPRELDELVKHIKEYHPSTDHTALTTSDLIKTFKQARYGYFKKVTVNYFLNKLDQRKQEDQLRALSRMFQPDGSGFLEPNQVPDDTG